MKRNLGFAFNNRCFSDKVLRVETISDNSPPSNFFHQLKLKRKNFRKKTNKNRVRTFHICSPILALNSPFFFKLFKNGMKESMQKHVTLKINSSEKLAFKDVLKFMYSNTLKATSTTGLLDVLMVADKFEVTSCVTHCSKLLRNKPLSLKLALLYLELPSSVVKILKPLKDVAKEYIVKATRDFNESLEKMMAFPLSAIEIVLGSNGLKVRDEYEIYNFIVKWARAHYPKLEERREIITKRLMRFIYFPYLSTSVLTSIKRCPDFDTERVSKLIFESLHFNAGFPYGRHIHIAPENTLGTSHVFIDRVYTYHPVKVVHLESNQPRCVIYMYLTRDDLEKLYESKQLFSQGVNLGGKRFHLCAQCTQDQDWFNQFGLYVNMGKGSETTTFGYEFEVLMAKEEGFRSKFKDDNCTSTKCEDLHGTDDLLGISWSDLEISGSEYFIDDILYLRAQLTLIK